MLESRAAKRARLMPCRCTHVAKNFAVPTYAVRLSAPRTMPLLRLHTLLDLTQGSPDICIVSVCGKPFPMHKKVLSVSSEMFSNLFDASTADPEDAVDGLPAIKMQERCDILTLVLPYCYNIPCALPFALPISTIAYL